MPTDTGALEVLSSIASQVTGLQIDSITLVVGVISILLIITMLDFIKTVAFSLDKRTEDDVVLDWEKQRIKHEKADSIRKREGLL